MLTPSWLLNADANLPNRLAWRLAALLAGTMAFTAVSLHYGYFDILKKTPLVPPPLPQSAPLAVKQAAPLAVKQPAPLAVKQAAPLSAPQAAHPTGETICGEPVTDFQRRIEFCARHVTADRSFVVFNNGTCVIIDEPTDDPIQSAIDRIKKCSGPDARFITRRIEADSYMITYKEPVFHCLFADEVAQLAPIVDQAYLSFLAPAERLRQPAGWEPPFDAKLGLMARTFLNADAQDQRVAKVIRALPIPEIDANAVQANNTP